MNTTFLEDDMRTRHFFFSGHSVFSSAIIQLGFVAFTEWIGILSSDVPVTVMDLTRIFIPYQIYHTYSHM